MAYLMDEPVPARRTLADRVQRLEERLNELDVLSKQSAAHNERLTRVEQEVGMTTGVDKY